MNNRRSFIKSVFLFLASFVAVLFGRQKSTAGALRPPIPPVREHWLGFHAKGVPERESRTVVAQVQDVFKPHRLVVRPSCAENFEITDIKIGTMTQFADSVSLPASAFVPQALNGVDFDTARNGEIIAITVRSVGNNGPQDFSAALVGSAVHSSRHQRPSMRI